MTVPMPEQDPAPGNDYADRLTRVSARVDSYVPPGHEAYARILHPVYAHLDADDDTEIPVPWAMLAEWNGTVLHRQVLLESVVQTEGGNFQAPGPVPAQAVSFFPAGARRVKLDPPRFGQTPPALLARLCALLREHDRTNQPVWATFWEGFGELEDLYLGHPTSGTPQRRYWVFRSSTEDITDLCSDVSRAARERKFRSQRPLDRHQFFSPAQCWPTNHAWAFGTDVDDFHTLVAGRRKLIDRIPKDPFFEAFEVRPDDRIAVDVEPENADPPAL